MFKILPRREPCAEITLLTTTSEPGREGSLTHFCPPSHPVVDYLVFVEIFLGHIILRHFAVRTSFVISSAASTALTISASNGLPSSTSSLTLSESAPGVRDSPCKSPDRPVERCSCVLTENSFGPRAFGVLFFFAFFFLGMTLMDGSTNKALHVDLSDRPHDLFV